MYGGGFFRKPELKKNCLTFTFCSHSDSSETNCIDVSKACLSSTCFELFSEKAKGKKNLKTTLTRIVFDEDLLKNNDNEFARCLLLEALMLLCKLHRQEEILLDGAHSVYIYSDEDYNHLHITHWCRRDVHENALFCHKDRLLFKLVKNVEEQSKDIIKELEKRREDLLLGCKEAHPQILKFTQKIFHSTCKCCYTNTHTSISLS